MLKERDVLDALPPTGFLREYVHFAMSCTDAHAAYHLACGLIGLSQAVPPSYLIPFASPIYGNMFTMVVGDSSKSRKTTAINIIQNMMREAIPGSVGETPGSTEGVSESLRANPRQVIIYGEFGEFLAKAENGYLMPLKTAYTGAWDCLSADTEVLTESGWKKRGEVATGDMVYSLNRQTDRLELVPALDVGERPVRDGERMAVTKSMRLNIRTTEGHDYYIKYRNKGAPSKGFLKRTGAQLADRKGGYLLPLAASPEKDFPGVPLTDDEIRFIGWFITDGYRDEHKLTISQSKPERVAEIRDLLTRVGFDFTEGVQQPNEGTYPNAQPCHVFRIPKGTGLGGKARDGWYRLAEYLDKDIAPALRQMTRGQFHVLWKEALKGNGDNTVEEYESDGLYTSRKTQADNLMHMAVARGFSTNYGLRTTDNGVKMYRVVVRTAQYLQVDPTDGAKTELINPEPGEMVWCVTNQNGTLVTRHAGRVVILGNCSPMGRATANSRRGMVTDPRLSLLCGVATDLLERHTEQADWTGGFLARFLTFHAEPERLLTSMPIPDRATKNHLTNWLRQLADPMMVPGECLWLDAPEKLIWDQWWASLKPMRDSANRRAQAACARAGALAQKVALLIAWDLGEGRTGQPFYISREAVESAIRITTLHIESVLELGERVTGNKDMRDRAMVLRAIGDKLVPLGVIIKNTDMLKKRIKDVVESLLEERSIEAVASGNLIFYRQTPESHQRLVQIADQMTEATLNGTELDGGIDPQVAKIIPMMKPLTNPTVEDPFEANRFDDIHDAEYDSLPL